MKPVLTPEVLDDLYGWLAERAAGGRACPGNAEIAKRYRFASVATAAKAVGRLENLGRIAVQRGWTARQATILATGVSTAPIRQANRQARNPPQPKQRPVVMLPTARIVGPGGRQCQWIEGEPSGDDSCKCLRKTARGSAWCRAHGARVYLPPDVAERRFSPLPVLLARRAAP
jgi:hypothetical protein